MSYSTGDKEEGGKFGYTLLALALLGLGSFILYDFYVYKASKSWPSADARVIGSRTSCGPGKKTNCTAHVSYSYLDFTAEAEIHSDGLFPAGQYSAEESLKRFQPGSKMLVHYDPANPRRSRPADGGAMDWRMGLLLAGLGWLILYSTWRRGAEEAPAAPAADKAGAGTITFIVIVGLLGLLLPAAIILLLGAGGLLPVAYFAVPETRWSALAGGMLLGGFGICTAPLGLPLVLKWLRLPKKAADFISGVLAGPWAGGAALLVLTAYAIRALYPHRGLIVAGENLVFSGLALAAGVGVRTYLGLVDRRRARGFGVIGLDRKDVTCAPGAELSVVLSMEHKARTVTADLELYGEDEEPRARYQATVGQPIRDRGGWSYRISLIFPEGVAVPKDGCWDLSVTAEGDNGAVYRDYVTVEEPGLRSN